MKTLNIISILLLINLFLFNNCTHCQQNTQKKVTNKKEIQFMFYNVENLFDTFDDSLINDNEFLPGAYRNWTIERFNDKINKVYKVFMAAGKWSPPDIIGLCEVENYWVLNKLVNYTPFSKYEYKIVHYDSPDLRGIDVALLFNPQTFTLICSKPYVIKFKNSIHTKTRDILYIKGIANKLDTLHIFINHWPSRSGGQVISENKRVFAASILKHITDSILNLVSESKIIIMGDFNDEPNNKSISEILEAQPDLSNINNSQLYSISNSKNNNTEGTIKYKGTWSVYDQFIISGSLLNKQNGYYCEESDFSIFNPDFLLEKDENYSGSKPYRTYNGYKYNGGFSDHLPILLKLHLK